MKNKLKEWVSIQVAKNPGRMVLFAILLFNVVFFFFAACVISSMSVTGTEKMSFLEAAFCTITMILDAGCIQFVIADIGKAGVAVAIVCLAIIFIGMISFTGAVIGYITNYISGFIEKSSTGAKRLIMSDHLVILNWNTRASEIINDLLYSKQKEKIVVLAPGRKAEIEKEISERISDTLYRENQAVIQKSKTMPFIKGLLYLRKNCLTNNLTILVREGDVFSSKQLNDISLKYAKTVIILGNDLHHTVCKYEQEDLSEKYSRGNSQTIKTLMQVSDITGAADSADNQKIIVEITDEWTRELVNKIIKCKQVSGKCNIVPVQINQILGQILSQFSLMPELNLAYKVLFSNKGAAFYSREYASIPSTGFCEKYLANHRNAIPLATMEFAGKTHFYYVADSEKAIGKSCDNMQTSLNVKLNYGYWIEHKNVIILGHNSNCKELMCGFAAFRREWNRPDREILSITVIDDKANLEKMDYYRAYPFVTKIIAADIYDKDLICESIQNVVEQNSGEDTSVLILSDDSAPNAEIDANALANLVYVQDIINKQVESNDNFDRESIDVIVEIIDPKHHDIVNSYSVNNVVISNRYISKMITQIGEKEALFNFYSDILTYDTGETNTYESKEIYIKKVSGFFSVIPEKCTAEQLIRAVYEQSSKQASVYGSVNPTIVLGYVKPGGEMCIFEGDQSKIIVELQENDKLIVFSNH